MKSKHIIQMAGGMILCLAVIVNIHNRPAPNGALRNSEALGYDEFPITCDSAYGGFSLQYISGVLPSDEYALNSAFITAAALNYSHNDPVYWAGTYYNDSRSRSYNNPDEGLYYSDLISWWGYQTYNPMAPIMPDFCLIMECMDIEHRALLLLSGGFVWAVGTLELFPGNHPGDQSFCEYSYVNASNTSWGWGDIKRISTDEFTLTVSSSDLYLAGCN